VIRDATGNIVVVEVRKSAESTRGSFKELGCRSERGMTKRLKRWIDNREKSIVAS
jgi:hypothetical protein